ncbi:hypothetical protein M8J76_003315 [Diaphorina citri]|nr:hypothetical protein M8J76_003315 [Diaphorina citri]
MCTSLSSVSLLCGFLSLGTLLTAFVSNVWIYTKEPVKLPSSDIQTTVLFRIGLWRVCPTYKRINSTIDDDDDDDDDVILELCSLGNVAMS